MVCEERREKKNRLAKKVVREKERREREVDVVCNTEMK